MFLSNFSIKIVSWGNSRKVIEVTPAEGLALMNFTPQINTMLIKHTHLSLIHLFLVKTYWVILKHCSSLPQAVEPH